MLQRWRAEVRKLKQETYAIYLAARDPRTPWYARLFAFVIVAYAVSPIDLIPDVIPILGLLDDIVLVPLGILLVIRLIPHSVLAEARLQAATDLTSPRPGGKIAATIILVIWATLIAMMIWFGWQWINGRQT